MPTPLEVNLTNVLEAIAKEIRTLRSANIAKVSNTRIGVLGLDQPPPGAIIRCLWDGATWTWNGSTITSRPSARTDIFFDLHGAPASTASPSWMITGDSRTDA